MSGDGGAHTLVRLLLRCSLLAILRFSGTRVGRDGSVAFARALATSPSAPRAAGAAAGDVGDARLVAAGVVAVAVGAAAAVCVFAAAFAVALVTRGGLELTRPLSFSMFTGRGGVAAIVSWVDLFSIIMVSSPSARSATAHVDDGF